MVGYIFISFPTCLKCCIYKVIDVRFPQPSAVLKDTISSPLFFVVIVFSNTAIHASLGFWRTNLRKIVSDISCNICSDYENQKVFNDRNWEPSILRSKGGRNEMKMHMRILPYMPRKCLSQTLECFDCFSSKFASCFKVVLRYLAIPFFAHGILFKGYSWVILLLSFANLFHCDWWTFEIFPAIFPKGYITWMFLVFLRCWNVNSSL